MYEKERQYQLDTDEWRGSIINLPEKALFKVTNELVDVGSMKRYY